MPDTLDIDGILTEKDAENGRTLAAEVGTVLLFLYFYGLFDMKGRPIPSRVVLNALDGLRDVAKGRIAKVTTQLLDGQISVAVWQARMANIIKAGYIVNGAAMRGGIGKMSAGDWRRLGGMSSEQMGYLNRFAKQLAEGLDKSPAQILARAKSYANAFYAIGQDLRLGAMQDFNQAVGGWARGELARQGRAIFTDDRHLIKLRKEHRRAWSKYHDKRVNGRTHPELRRLELARERAEKKMAQFVRVAQAQAQRVDGEYMEGRRILDPYAENCEGCIFWAAQGWIPADIIPPLRTQECNHNCRCRIDYRMAQGVRAAREASDRYRNPPEYTVVL